MQPMQPDAALGPLGPKPMRALGPLGPKPMRALGPQGPQGSRCAALIPTGWREREVDVLITRQRVVTTTSYVGRLPAASRPKVGLGPGPRGPKPDSG